MITKDDVITVLKVAALILSLIAGYTGGTIRQEGKGNTQIENLGGVIQQLIEQCHK